MFIDEEGVCMKVFQSHYQEGCWSPELPEQSEAQWVLTFGDRKLTQDNLFYDQLKKKFQQASITGCSTSGEIFDTQVFDNTMVLTAITFEKSQIKPVHVSADDFNNSFDAGKALAEQLLKEGLKYVFVLSDGQKVNGTELVNGLSEHLPNDVLISGGLAGDGSRFEETMVWCNNHIESGLIVVCGFYGDNLKFGYGTLGGWDAFGPERKVTKSKGNILLELDNKPALELYKSYLGDYSKELPSSALLFPLSIKSKDQPESVVRTILSIDESEQSMVFAGDIPQGATARLMKANFDRLVDGAIGAAENAMTSLANNADLAILISCVGRRLVLKQRVDEELEGVDEALNGGCVKCGFYSYGEISPLLNHTDNACQLHNQTMTITTIAER
jgi:hypothetical protein